MHAPVVAGTALKQGKLRAGHTALQRRLRTEPSDARASAMTYPAHANKKQAPDKPGPVGGESDRIALERMNIRPISR